MTMLKRIRNWEKKKQNKRIIQGIYAILAVFVIANYLRNGNVTEAVISGSGIIALFITSFWL